MGPGFLLGTLALKQAEKALPWYDSLWLRRYRAALNVIERLKPAKRAEFVGAFERLRTPSTFQPRRLDRVFDDGTMARIRQTIAALPPDLVERHELEKFGRLVVHDHAFFNVLQKVVVPLASELAGEALEPSYNFLSLYTQNGVCQPHMDAPEAKWTLDICIDQSHGWPIHLSQVVPWPLAESYAAADWQQNIKEKPGVAFSTHVLQPGEAVWFSGSSQWHYRDSLASIAPGGFCTLLFFHFLPKGMAEIAEPRNWPRLFDLAELVAVVGA